MEIVLRVLLYAIFYLLIPFLHIWAFWRIYKEPFGDRPGFDAIARGGVAGCKSQTFWLVILASLFCRRLFDRFYLFTDCRFLFH